MFYRLVSNIVHPLDLRRKFHRQTSYTVLGGGECYCFVRYRG